MPTPKSRRSFGIFLGGCAPLFLYMVLWIAPLPAVAQEEVVVTEGYMVIAEEIAVQTPAAWAIDDPCSKVFDCLVPAPTMIAPATDAVYGSSGQVIITGLSWNQTVVDVYIDGIYNGRAELRTDPSEIGNFVYQPFLPLTPGIHTVYVVARNLSEQERSPESIARRFTVLSPEPPAQFPILPADEIAVTGKVTSTPESVSAPSANSVLDSFFNYPGNEQGDLIEEATTSSGAQVFPQPLLGRIATLLLVVFLVAGAAWYALRPRSVLKEPQQALQPSGTMPGSTQIKDKPKDEQPHEPHLPL